MLDAATRLEASALDTLFREARTHNKFTGEPVSDDTLRELYDILKWGPTSANSSPARFLFLRTGEAKERLAPALSSGNLDKTMAAPVTVIVAYDPRNSTSICRDCSRTTGCAVVVHQQRGACADHRVPQWHAAGRLPDRGCPCGWAGCRADVGLRQRQGRCGFFAGYGWRSNFLVNLGHGDPAGCTPDPPASISRMRAGCSDPVQQQSASGVWRRPSPVLSLIDSGHLRNEWDLAQKRVHTVDHGGSHGGPRRCYSVQQPDELRGAPSISAVLRVNPFRTISP